MKHLLGLSRLPLTAFIFLGVCLLLLGLLALWWRYSLPLALQRVESDLKQQGISINWDTAPKRSLSPAEDIQRVDAIYAAIDQLEDCPAVSHLIASLYPSHEEDTIQLMTSYEQVDGEIMASIRKQLRLWYQERQPPIQRYERLDLDTPLIGASQRYTWSKLARARTQLPLPPQERAQAITDMLLLLPLREEPTIIQLIIDARIAHGALVAMAKNKDIWPHYGATVLNMAKEFFHHSYWQEYHAQAVLADIRLFHDFLQQPFDNAHPSLSSEGLGFNAHLRLSGEQFLRDIGHVYIALNQETSHLPNIIQSIKQLDHNIFSRTTWWSRQTSFLSHEKMDVISGPLRNWVENILIYQIFLHEMGQSPWPQDPWDESGKDLRRYPEHGPLERAWSVGPNGIDNGGDWQDDLLISWPPQ